ncbi:hypothetical protein [Aeromonas dhakensis]|uniref:hypothetical protein n=1 Tax=Aeromonas dhakensis TaxID=196024 RepID=UPI002446C504|nr:hypothetical protein [Aeromonas dhakensis]MDH0348191.1 hypothetical protein [Aeromonas dhakensis]
MSVNETLTIQQIRTVLVARGSQLAHNAIEGCLHSLGRAGLVVVTADGFRATFDASQPYNPTSESEKEATSMTTSIEITVNKSTVSVTAPASVCAEPAAPNGIQAATDRIAAIGAEVVEVVDGVRQQLNKLTRLGSEMEELAIQITMETDHVNDQIEKLGRIQALMRELGVAS